MPPKRKENEATPPLSKKSRKTSELGQFHDHASDALLWKLIGEVEKPENSKMLWGKNAGEVSKCVII